MNKIVVMIFYVTFLLPFWLKTTDQIVIGIIIDQLSYSAFKKIEPYLKGGMKELLNYGTFYNNAHFHYARTSTGPGHATISTGTLPKTHGIIANNWREQGKKLKCDAGCKKQERVFSARGVYEHAKSAKNLKVDTLSDQLLLDNQQNKKTVAFALSIKSRAAILLAGHSGKAIWYDSKSGLFTSSMGYYQQLPAWVTRFNKEKKLHTFDSFTWKLYFSKTNPAYEMVKDNYDYARLNSFINKKVTIEELRKDQHKKHDNFDAICHSPQSNKLLFDLAQECLKDSMQQNPAKTLLWISLSSLDKIGHIFGPDSFEYIDTLYHIDNYLKDFIDFIKECMPNKKVTFVLTSDHGTSPIIELINQDGFSLARRLLTHPLRDKLNKDLAQKYDIENAIIDFNMPCLYLNHDNLSELSSKKRRSLINTIKKSLMNHPDILNVWTLDELDKKSSLPDEFATYYKNSLYKGRSGDIFYQTAPYVYINHDHLGTGHAAPYDYTTHVPLLIHYAGQQQKNIITTPVSMTQLAPTLAQIFSIAPPSASLSAPLPNMKCRLE